MDNQNFLQKSIILAIGFSLMGCITTGPQTANGERINLDPAHHTDYSLTCSEISKQMSDIDVLLNGFHADTVDNVTQTVVTQAATDVALRTGYQMIPGGAMFLPQAVAIGQQYMVGLQQNEQQIASKARIRKNFLVSLYDQKSCHRKTSIVRNEQVRDVQLYLNKLGYPCGSPDGIMGQKTRDAIEIFQVKNGLLINGQVTTGLLKQLQQAAD